MTIILSWLRLELRRRWRSLAVLMLLIALASCTVFAALAGARRGASAQERLDARTLPADAAVLPNTPGFDWRPIRKLPEVAAMTTFVVDYEMSTIGTSGDGISFPPGDAAMLRTIEKPVIFEGRNLDPTRADEVVATPEFVKYYGKGVGDTVTVVLATPQEIIHQEPSGPHGTYTGPRITMHIVGVGETSPRWGVDQPGGHGGVQLSPGLIKQYRENIVGPAGTKTLNYINALVRLRHGEADLLLFERDLARVTGRSDIDVWNFAAVERTTQRHIAFESRCLVAFAAAALVAALFLVGQAIARYAAASTEELRTLRAIGMTPRQAMRTSTAGPAIAGVLGAAMGVGGAIIASRWLPFGTAGLLEPSPGISLDWVVLGPGLVIVIALVAGGAYLASSLALAAARREGRTRRSTIAMTAARGGLPTPIVVGARFALETGRGKTAVPVRPALIGSVMGVLGVIAAFTFSHGVSDAASNPERFGQTFQLGAFAGINGQDFGPTSTLVRSLQDNDDVTGVDDARTAVASVPNADSVSVWAYSGGPKAMPVVITAGRMVASADEIVLAPRTLSDMHAAIGDEVSLTGSRNAPAHFTVVGVGLVPVGPHNGYADGAWTTAHGYDRLFDGFKFHLVLVALRPQARGAGAGHALYASVVKGHPELKNFQFGPPDPIAEVAALREVEKLPLLLGFFLAALAIGAVGHALATAVRRRSHDLAVLRALGMTRSQCRWVVVTQATVLAVIGVFFGVPLGLALGRTIWRIVADYTPVEYVPPTALLAVLLILPGALLLANLLAAWPGQRAARMRIAHILRTE